MRTREALFANYLYLPVHFHPIVPNLESFVKACEIRVTNYTTLVVLHCHCFWLGYLKVGLRSVRVWSGLIVKIAYFFKAVYRK